jgi:head-tail adaptor
MLSGRLRDRVTILERITTPTPGGVEETWEADGDRWGRVAPVSVQNAARYQQALNTEVTHTVTFRGRVELSIADNRIGWRNRQYRIVQRTYDVDGTGKTTMCAIRELLEEVPDGS